MKINVTVPFVSATAANNFAATLRAAHEDCLSGSGCSCEQVADQIEEVLRWLSLDPSRLLRPCD